MIRRYQTSIKIIVTALCVFFLLRIVPVATLVDTLKGARVAPLLIVFALVVPAVLTRAWRWYLILRARGLAASLATVTKATLIGMALNLFLPASSGDIARSYYGWKRHGNKEAMLATALSDKVVALLTLCALGVCGQGGQTKGESYESQRAHYSAFHESPLLRLQPAAVNLSFAGRRATRPRFA